MKRVAIVAAAAFAAIMAPVTAPAQQAPAQATAASPFTFTFEEVMVPMRDGAKLQTVVMRPTGKAGPLPILLQRTPYGVPGQALPAGYAARYKSLVNDGYIMVFQSMRGRFKSDGVFTLSTAVHPYDAKAVDEATDAYDTIDWLVKNVRPNNGRVGMWGVSYPGFAAAIALVHPHPALKAISPQAAWLDYWQSDDLHRNGALRLSYATDWVSSLQLDKTQNKDFVYPGVDTYDFFLKEGSAAAIDRDYFHGQVPLFTALLDHPNHDSFYTGQRWTDALGRTTVPTLNVAGFWDQEDPWGSWRIYERQAKNDPDHLAQMVSGPWNHGGWQGKGDFVANGAVPIGTASGDEFKDQIQAPFFRYWLHGKGERPAFAAKMFQSGSNVWKTYKAWPPAGATATDLYLHADGSLSFTAPAAAEACRSYTSDPANPVPFRARPISPTYPAPEWRSWEAADQRFVDHRPDVLSYVSAPLTADLTVTGALAATLMASTSGTDSDFVVKLIDVLPAGTQAYSPESAKLGSYTTQLNEYQLPVAMEVRRGRFLASDTDPRPLKPGKVVAWDVPLRDHDHVFRAGHRIMVQVQSSWFPMIDRNPQSFVANIARAEPADYVKAEQRVCAGSRITLPVMR
ncbi:CocE/NonD family hydrolase [Sphingomonas bacterium]|uniref:CocE/NonD family hydrolase n=1 Tax=Sphingomonas bacterium TaxID=1895847 RepID=UPI00157586F4|nr:CocE/NonD family hydrolase [Sphingomonas bacterium]